MKKKSDHIEKCIRIWEMAAADYRKKEAEYRKKYEEAGPGSFWFDLMIEEGEVAHAYERCAEMLKDPTHFER